MRGRRAELRRLFNRLTSATTTVVVGEAGIGKTTVLRAAAEANGARARTFAGEGFQTLSWIPHHALAQAVGNHPRAMPPPSPTRWSGGWATGSSSSTISNGATRPP